MDELINEVLEVANEVYATLGEGHAEKVFEEAMSVEMRLRGILYETERNTEVFYKGHKVGTQRLDFVIDNRLVVELKAGMALTKLNINQLRGYLKTMNINHGLIINFPYPQAEEVDFKKIIVTRCLTTDAPQIAPAITQLIEI